MLKKASQTDLNFDGRKYSYIPGRTVPISPKLKLHTDYDEDIDPITYEVIRHNLWNINEEHGATIQRLSGSPVAIYAIDLNPSILTEDAEFVYFGPYMQYMSGVTDVQVKWILENRSENPGIRDGDMFLSNDPWVGAAHQQDVMLICPVFVDGELFCWTTNCLHQYDIGGITPGSFCPSARDSFDEGILVPPLKVIENHQIREDVIDVYLRASRRPDLVTLDFRAMMAGNMASRARILQLVERYGARAVKSAMKKVISNGEKAFLDKVSRLPDGVWRERAYLECSGPGDRGTYPVMLTLRKEGTELTFENEGTVLQGGSMNCTYAAWRGGLMVALNQLLCWDQYFAIGGALRHVNFDPTPGTMNCANYPASVSSATIQAMEISLYPTYNVISKMMYPDPALRPDIVTIGGCSQWPGVLFQGTDQRGEKFGYVLIDPIGGAIGAFAVGDGISTGGQSRTPISKLPNVEHNEQEFPMLFLYRKELTDSGGAGQYRGGQGAESCFIAHKTERLTHDTICAGAAVPSSFGLMGGYPAGPNAFFFKKDTDIKERFARSAIPTDISQLNGEDYAVQLRDSGFEQTDVDAYAVSWCGGAGFGDPFRRDPARIQADLDEQVISREAAVDLYGAVFDADGQVDSDATNRHRAATVKARVNPDRQRPICGGDTLFEVSPVVSVKSNDQGHRYACSCCSADLGPLSENYKAFADQTEVPIEQSNPLIGDPSRYVDAAIWFRSFTCPNCGALFDTEVAVGDDPMLHDMQVRLS
jgi:N-methylhydantoinase B